MPLVLRRGTLEDADTCGTICYEAFKTIAEQHNFTPDVSSPQATVAMFSRRLSHPATHVIVAELDGRVVGSNVLDERSSIVGIGPITVDPTVQSNSIGRQLMQAALDRVAERHCPGVRLTQAVYNSTSLCLYTKLGFEVRELLVNMQGASLGLQIPGYAVRQVTEADLDACNQVCRRVHGHDRSGELLDAIEQGTATVVEHGEQITGYATTIGVSGHAVGESNAEMKALIGATPEFVDRGFLLPARNGELFRWCLAHGLRVRQSRTLMSLGLYNEPRGVFLPSVRY
jgi:predicted N-acetyltransferase YhbS